MRVSSCGEGVHGGMVEGAYEYLLELDIHARRRNNGDTRVLCSAFEQLFRERHCRLIVILLRPTKPSRSATHKHERNTQRKTRDSSKHISSFPPQYIPRIDWHSSPQQKHQSTIPSRQTRLRRRFLGLQSAFRGRLARCRIRGGRRGR